MEPPRIEEFGKVDAARIRAEHDGGGVVLVNPKTGAEHFARVKVPPVLPRFLRVFEPGDDHGTQRAR